MRFTLRWLFLTLFIWDLPATIFFYFYRVILLRSIFFCFSFIWGLVLYLCVDLFFDLKCILRVSFCVFRFGTGVILFLFWGFGFGFGFGMGLG